MAKKARKQKKEPKKFWSLTEDNKMSFGGKTAFPIMAVSIFAEIFKFFCVIVIILAVYVIVVTDNYVGFVTVAMGVILLIIGFKIGKASKEANSEYLEKVLLEVNSRKNTNKGE